MFIFGMILYQSFSTLVSHKINKVKYICSSKVMLRAYKIRPHTFHMKILKYVYTDDYSDLLKEEQRFLDMIKPSELMTSENVKVGPADIIMLNLLLGEAMVK